ncbi:MAG: glycosyltransferase family 4 protein [bacterium]
MKIAIFSDTFSPQINGVTKNLDRLIEYFAKNNIDFIIFAPETEDVSHSKYEEKIIRMSSLNFFLYPELKFSIPNYLKVKKRLDGFQPELIHLVTPFNIGLAGLLYSKRNNIPFVASYHTNFNQYLEYYNMNFLEGTAWKFLKWFHNQALCNYCPSRDTLNYLRSKGFRNLDIWGRGIDADLFSPEYRDLNFIRKHNLENKVSLLYVGRLAREKNISLLIDSFTKLNEKYQNNIALIITGDGPLINDLKKRADKNTIFTGYKSGEELSRVYASADIFAFSSVTETYGNVIIEAMSSGLPVVAIMAGGIKENLIDGYNGIACYENYISEFTEKLEILIKDKDLRNKLGYNARTYAMKQTWDSVFTKLITSYRRILANHYRYKELKGNEKSIS